ncbi:hypothetical protein [Actinokineospora sp.]|uniref:hypothetical protein n=1 Tax=Actinokineospora sp. TaxID=1872133 RepID=UPI003D6A9AF2
METAVVRNGPQAYKTATLWFFGDRETGEIKRRALSVQSWNAKKGAGGYDFTEKASSWSCENDEIDELLVFLSGELGEPGIYRKVDPDGSLVAVIRKVQAGEAELRTAATLRPDLAQVAAYRDLLGSRANRVRAPAS